MTQQVLPGVDALLPPTPTPSKPPASQPLSVEAQLAIFDYRLTVLEHNVSTTKRLMYGCVLLLAARLLGLDVSTLQGMF